MELVTTRSEEGLTELLGVIEKDPASWVNVHVNISRLSEQMLEREALSAQLLENIRQSSLHIARTLVSSNLDGFEGKIFVFEDSDVIALFRKGPASFMPAIEKLRREFSAGGLADIFAIGDMQERLASLIELSEEKRKGAELYRERQCIVEAADAIFTNKFLDPKLTHIVRQKRLGRKKASALIIEDDIVARGIVARTLRDVCHVIHAKDAKSGIISYIDKAPNVVFLDIHLPDHNGREVLERLKMLDPEAYVVMLSGDSVSENVLAAKTLGAAGFVRKPFLKENILKHIKNIPA